jgi:hypothetical protein
MIFGAEKMGETAADANWKKPPGFSLAIRPVQPSSCPATQMP